MLEKNSGLIGTYESIFRGDDPEIMQRGRFEQSSRSMLSLWYTLEAFGQ